jgi:hypothetical protein
LADDFHFLACVQPLNAHPLPTLPKPDGTGG